MTNKQLLFIDLCGRIPYRPLVRIGNKDKIKLPVFWLADSTFEDVKDDILECKPYLKPMWLMSSKELVQYNYLLKKNDPASLIDWLNKGHYDFRGLSKAGLAYPAHKYFYPEPERLSLAKNKKNMLKMETTENNSNDFWKFFVVISILVLTLCIVHMCTPEDRLTPETTTEHYG